MPYNQVPELDDGVAAVIVEPVAANMGVVAPQPGFLDGLRAECDRVGALLIFDEVITGFRLDTGGAQAKYDVMPDLTTFGKVIGGGLPIGAVGGRRDVMETLSPLGPVFHAGTLAGNPLATAAGLAALDQLDADVYMELLGPRPPAGGGAARCVRRGRASRPSSRSSARCRHGVRRRHRAASTSTAPGAPTRQSYAALLPRHARRRRRPGARRLRGDVRRPRPRRRGDRARSGDAASRAASRAVSPMDAR